MKISITIGIEEIAAALKEAQKAAALASTADDGGTCNLDSVIIDFKGWRQKKIDELIAKSGIGIGDALSGWHKGFRFIRFEVMGQGNNRTRTVKAAKRKLNELGVDASIYYQMD